MRLEWLTRPAAAPTIAELEARGCYAKAADRLRAELATRTPTVADRLRLADLLVHADRGEEALPILVGIADEQARFGFREKALEALRRADAIAPGDPALRERIEAVARSKAQPFIAGRKVKGAA